MSERYVVAFLSLGRSSVNGVPAFVFYFNGSNRKIKLVGNCSCESWLHTLILVKVRLHKKTTHVAS